MRDAEIGQLHRRLRQRAGLTQALLAQKSGVARWKIVRIEAGDLDALRHREMRASFIALDARLDCRVVYRGAAVERLLDEGHARLVSRIVALLKRRGWEARVEVSFSEYGERGSIDVLGWHPAEYALLVVEVKSELGGVEGTLRPLHAKQRLARTIAAKQFGWRPRTVSRILVLPEERSARRAVQRHEVVLRAALPATSQALRAWLRKPSRPVAGIWFLSPGAAGGSVRNPSAIRRVRRPR